MWHNYGNWGWGNWFFMSLTMLVFWGLLVALIVWLVRSSRADPAPGSGSRSTSGERADEVLAERFARGEIDAEEFQRRRDLLHSGAARDQAR